MAMSMPCPTLAPGVPAPDTPGRCSCSATAPTTSPVRGPESELRPRFGWEIRLAPKRGDDFISHMGTSNMVLKMCDI